jgi:hypothetical protein
MDFYIPPLPTGMIFQAPASGIEGISHGYMQILIGLAVHHELCTGYCQIDSHRVRAFAVVTPRPFHDHAAIDDVLIIGIKIASSGANIGLRHFG